MADRRSILGGVGIPAIEMSQTQIGYNWLIFIAGGMDRLAQLLNEQFDVETRAGRSTRVLSQRFGADGGAGDFAKFFGDLVDRGLGEVSTELQNGGLPILAGVAA